MLWKTFVGQAKYFSHYPSVFREVLGQYGGHLANVGVTVWPGSCGHGVIVPRVASTAGFLRFHGAGLDNDTTWFHA